MQFAAFRHFLAHFCVCSCTVNAMQLNVTENIPAVDVFACTSRVLSTMRSLPHKYSMYISVHGNIDKSNIRLVAQKCYWQYYKLVVLDNVYSKILSGKTFTFRLEKNLHAYVFVDL